MSDEDKLYIKFVGDIFHLRVKQNIGKNLHKPLSFSAVATSPPKLHIRLTSILKFPKLFN